MNKTGQIVKIYISTSEYPHTHGGLLPPPYSSYTCCLISKDKWSPADLSFAHQRTSSPDRKLVNTENYIFEKKSMSYLTFLYWGRGHNTPQFLAPRICDSHFSSITEISLVCYGVKSCYDDYYLGINLRHAEGKKC